MKLSKGALAVIERLEGGGFEAYAVGGCVRDAWMGVEPKDYDITTNAPSASVKRLFSHTFDTGIQHGTVTVLWGKEALEVTTYRTDGLYQDHRHPESVTFASTLAEDLSRRDFTINAMAYNPRAGIVDLFEGREDIRKKRIRCVGEARRRFEEDALRMLRALRFGMRLGFDIEEETFSAIRAHASDLAYVSRERIFEEMKQIAVAPLHEEMMTNSGLMPYISSAFSKNAPGFALANGVRGELCLRLSAFLSPFGKEGALQILREWKSDNDTAKKVAHLIEFLPEPLPQSPLEMRRLVSRIGRESFEPYLSLKTAKLVLDGRLSKEEAAEKRGEVLSLYDTQKDCPLTLSELGIGGQQLLLSGIPKGPAIGEALHYLLDKVVEDPSLNQTKTLLKLLSER